MSLDPGVILSLIIPTRERAESLKYTIATALDQTSQDYEVLVSDNASRDRTQNVVAVARDARVRYVNTGQRLSMCDNYEFGLRHANGEYVIFIGDDDAVMPGAIDRLLGLMRTQPNSLIYTWPVHIYDWPSDQQPARAAYLAPQSAAKELDLRGKAKFVIRMGGWKYYELPSVYHSAIAQSLLDRIRTETGRVFHSTQPDVFTAMALPAMTDRALNLGQTITLHGRSPKSNGWGFVKKTGLANLQRFIDEYGGYQFHPTLYPAAHGTANMIPDAILLAMDYFPAFYGGLQFNYDAMWAYMCRYGFACRQELLRNRSAINRYHTFNAMRFLFYLAVQDMSALRRHLLDQRINLGKPRQTVPGNIQDFVRAIPRPESY